MERRYFLRSGAIATGSLISGSVLSVPDRSNKILQPDVHAFKLKYAPHFGMFKHHAGDDLLDQIQFMSDTGFTALEDNGMKSREISIQNKIASKVAQLNLEMGVFVASSDVNLTSGDQSGVEKFLVDIKSSVEVAKRVNAKWMTVVPGKVDQSKEIEYQTRNVIEALKRASEIFESHNLIMVLEPLNFLNHPGLFLKKISQAFQICRAVGSPSCKILDDLYHQQIQEGNLTRNIDLAWEEIAYFQVGDNPGRKEPTTGEINFQNIFKHIHSKGYKGIVGMEHDNSVPGKEGELALIKAYQDMDVK